MPVSFSIKNVPDAVADRLRIRAAHNHRSLQGELIALLEESLFFKERTTLKQVLKQVRTMGLRTPSESVRMIRADRNAR